mgnify:CR=1 FL=1
MTALVSLAVMVRETGYSNDDVNLCDDEDCIDCEEEGWYWFAKDGKVYNKGGQKKIDGRYYYFKRSWPDALQLDRIHR